jgi:hypothetical protein
VVRLTQRAVIHLEVVMKKKFAVLEIAPLLTLSLAGAAEAGQKSGSKNCGSQWILTQGTGYGNQVHLVGGSGTQWSHPIGTLASHSYYSGLSSASWSITTGGAIITGVANCWTA